jgi:hypothetical protein
MVQVIDLSLLTRHTPSARWGCLKEACQSNTDHCQYSNNQQTVQPSKNKKNGQGVRGEAWKSDCLQGGRWENLCGKGLAF